MLLTSSQVSVLITSGIVVLCTFALFLSGYTIQQRTLRDLRSAIRPAVVTRPKPKVITADTLKKIKTAIRLEDGTRVEIVDQMAELGNAPEDQEGEIIEVRPTIPEVEEQAQKPIAAPPPKDEDDNDDASALKIERQEASWDGVQEGGKPLSRAERRRRIKAEIQRLSQADKPVYYQRRLW